MNGVKGSCCAYILRSVEFFFLIFFFELLNVSL